MTESKKGLFYMYSRDALHEILEATDDVLPALTYLVLRKHAQSDKNPQRSDENKLAKVVWAGENAVSNVLGTGRKVAKRALDDLMSIAWGKEYNETALLYARDWNAQCSEDDRVPEGGYGGKSFKVTPAKGDTFIPLPNALCETHGEHRGKARKTPLEQLLRIKDKETRVHALKILLGLYEHLDLGSHGGSDPTQTISIPWRYEGEAQVGESGIEYNLGHLGSEQGVHFWLIDQRSRNHDFWGDSSTSAVWEFITSTTGEQPGETPEKFWKAMRELRDLGLIYEVAMVFDCDPFTHPYAEVLYPLWVFNESERGRLDARGNGEGGLAKANMNAAERLGTDLLMEVFESDGTLEATGVFMAASDHADARVVGVFRPRFLPNDDLSRRATRLLASKSLDWKATIERLGKYQG